MAQGGRWDDRTRLQVLPGLPGHHRASGEPPLDLDGLRRDAVELRAEVLALRDLFEEPAFLAWALQRALDAHPDLRLLARYIVEQLGPS